MKFGKDRHVHHGMQQKRDSDNIRRHVRQPGVPTGVIPHAPSASRHGEGPDEDQEPWTHPQPVKRNEQKEDQGKMRSEVGPAMLQIAMEPRPLSGIPQGVVIQAKIDPMETHVQKLHEPDLRDDVEGNDQNGVEEERKNLTGTVPQRVHQIIF